MPAPSPDVITTSGLRARLGSTLFGRIFLANLEWDLCERQIEADLIETFAAAVEPLVSAGHTFVEIIEDVRARKIGTFAGCRSPRHDGHYCVVVRLSVFADYYFDYARYGLDKTAADNNLIWSLITSRSTAVRGSLRGVVPIVWLTREDSIPAIAKGDALATELRNRLGLPHFGQDERLVLIRIPFELIRSMTLVAPTTLDGGTNWAFAPDHGPDDFGMTRDLRNMSSAMPEAIAPPIPLDADCSAEAIGRVQMPPPPVDHVAWCECLEKRTKGAP